MKFKPRALHLLIIVLMALLVSLRPPDLAGAQEDQKTYFPIVRRDRLPDEFAGMDGGTVECIAIDPNNSDVIYAGTWGNGVYKSYDRGENWVHSSDNLQSPYIYDIAVDPQNSQHVLISVYKHGVNQSFDGGYTWGTTIGIPTGSVIYSIDFHPQNSSIVYVGLRQPTVYDQWGNPDYPGGVYKSYDGGSIWYRKSNGLSYDYVYDLAIDPNNPNIIFAGMHDTGVYKTIDGGENWHQKYVTLPPDDIDIRSVDIDPVNNIIYIGHWDGDGFSFSTEGGSNWVRVNWTDINNLYVYEVLVDQNHPSTVYLITTTGLFVCENPRGGSTCSVVNYDGDFVLDLALDLTGSINTQKTKGMYTGLQYLGIFTSVDTGVSFEDINQGVQANIINSLLINPENPSTQYASSFGRGLYKSLDDGLTWNPINNGLSDPFVNVIEFKPGNTNILYAGTQSKGVFISNNGGDYWSETNTGLASLPFDEVEGIDVDGRLGFVDNFAYEWMDPVDRESLEILEEHKNADRSTPYPSITSFSFDPSNPAKMIAGTNGSGVKISDNSGLSWSNSYLTTGKVFDSFTDPSVGVNFYYIGMADSSIRVSNSSRLEWTIKNTGFHDLADVFTLEKSSGGTYYAGTESGVYKTTNAGETWTQIGLIDIEITDIMVDPSNVNIVWAASHNGLFRSTNGGGNWTAYNYAWLFNEDILMLTKIPDSSLLYVGTNGGNFYLLYP